MFDLFNFTKTPYKLGVVLSGGGARGFAHAGALKAMEEMAVVPDIIAGVSAGAVVTALYCGGNTPEQIVDAFIDAKFGDFASLTVPKDGFFVMDGFKRFLAKHIPYERIEQLPRRAVICATDLDNGKPVAWREGELAERVVASCSIPIIFKPMKIDDTNYVDGGVLHNLPAWALREQCKYLIGVNCSPVPRRGHPKSLMDIAQRTYDLLVKTNSVPDMALCDLAVPVPSVASYRVFNLREIRSVYRAGYNAMATALRDSGFKPRLANILQPIPNDSQQ